MWYVICIVYAFIYNTYTYLTFFLCCFDKCIAFLVDNTNIFYETYLKLYMTIIIYFKHTLKVLRGCYSLKTIVIIYIHFFF